MKHVVAKFVLWLLLPEQKEYRALVANDLIQISTDKSDLLKKDITLKGTEASSSYVPCFLHLVSPSINVSIFLSTWLDTSWTDLHIWALTMAGKLWEAWLQGRQRSRKTLHQKEVVPLTSW